GVELAALRREREGLDPVSRAQRRVAVVDRQREVEPAAFDPEGLRDAERQAVAVLEQAAAGHIERPRTAGQARSAGDEPAAARPGPAVAEGGSETPLGGEIPPRLGIDEQRVGPGEAERAVEFGPEHRSVLA